MNLTIGERAPIEVNVFIEIPEGSRIKYELDPEMDVMIADRFIHGAMHFPGNYGFIPETLGEDGDPLDILVIASYPVAPGVVIAARPIGMLEMEDEAGNDTKIIAVPLSKVDPFYKEVREVTDLPEMVSKKIKNFFDRYKDLEEGKWVKTKDFLGKKAALDAISAAQKK